MSSWFIISRFRFDPPVRNTVGPTVHYVRLVAYGRKSIGVAMSQPANPLAIVIGGASGIGSAVAGGLAAEGHRVIVADRNAAGAATRVAELGAPHTSAAVDVTDEDTVAALFEQAGPVDVVV